MLFPLKQRECVMCMRWFERASVLCVGFCVACGPDQTTDNTQTMTSGMDMSVQPVLDMSGGQPGELGAICGMSTQCASGFCVASQCAASAGPACGTLHCRGQELCEAGVCQASPSCPAEQVCGTSCCEAGQSCQAGECVTLCEDDRLPCEDDTGSSQCCAQGAACLFGGCVELGDVCGEQTPCERGQFCEPTLSRCVPRDADPNQCIYIPPVGAFDPVEAWSWTGSMISPEYDQIMASPIVGNLTDDNGDGVIDRNDIPDVVFTTFRGSRYNYDGVLRVISGDDGREIWSSTGLPNGFVVRGATTPALADIDADGVMEIILAIDPEYDVDEARFTTDGVMAVEHTGEIKWVVNTIASDASGGPAIANVDGQGLPEILVGNALLNANGEVICQLGPRVITPTFADVDLDDQLELVMGSSIWEVDDAMATDGTGCTQSVTGVAGRSALANLDEDPHPEIVVTTGRDIVLFEHDGTEIWRQEFPLDIDRAFEVYNVDTCERDDTIIGQDCTASADCQRKGICSRQKCIVAPGCSPSGGPPTIADFDGDGEAEIAVAGRWYYLVYEADGSVSWAHSTKDYSSGVTGSSVFDFEGDGNAEVVYNDEAFLRVYSGVGTGADGDDPDPFNDPVILLETPNSSGTLYEYPLIVDVDNDGNAEIVVSANDYAFGEAKGIRVFKDRQNNWVGTRRIWNQHSYHVTNIDEDGQVPLTEERNWQVPYLNNYRQNVQGDGLFNAPDLVVETLVGDGSGCAGAGAEITITLANQGSLGVRAGALSASVYVGETEPLTKVGVVTNSMALAPGASSVESFTYTPDPSELNKELLIRVVVDEDIDGDARYNECDEDNNTLDATMLCESAG